MKEQLEYTSEKCGLFWREYKYNSKNQKLGTESLYNLKGKQLCRNEHSQKLEINKLYKPDKQQNEMWGLRTNHKTKDVGIHINFHDKSDYLENDDFINIHNALMYYNQYK